MFSVYASDNTRGDFSKDMNALFNYFQIYKAENKYILLRDLKSKHQALSDSIVNPRGKYLQKWI